MNNISNNVYKYYTKTCVCYISAVMTRCNVHQDENTVLHATMMTLQSLKLIYGKCSVMLNYTCPYVCVKLIGYDVFNNHTANNVTLNCIVCAKTLTCLTLCIYWLNLNFV